jgi:hypothetical protein
MKQLCLFLIWILMICSFAESSHLKLESENSSMKKKLPKGPLFWEGWIKFFKYRTEEVSKPVSFFVNNEYFKQNIHIADRMKKDSKGNFLYIPTKFHFYGYFMEKYFNILYSQDKKLTKSSDSLNFELILPIDPKNKFKSSIKDLGGFNEGHCISIPSKIPGSPNTNFDLNDTRNQIENWIICLETQKEKETLFAMIIDYKINLQSEEKKKSEIANETKQETNMASLLKPEKKPKIERYEGPDASLKDGYLMLLNDWSQCTLKCGGGFQYQQWACVPPKQGGRPCNKELIRKRSCNSQPCPGQKLEALSSLLPHQSEDKILVENVNLEPIIKSLPFSTRPQQYTKCVIRENDVLLTEESKEAGLTQLPSRLILNKRSISLFRDDNFEGALFNFNLDKTEFFPSKKDHCCFDLASENKSFSLCSFGNECGSKENPKFVNEWKLSFNLFKSKCLENHGIQDSDKTTALPSISNPNTDEGALSGMNLSESEASERSKLIEKKIEESNGNKFDKKLESTQIQVMKSMKKEMNIEELLKKEIMLKTKKETEELLEVMKHEKKKKDQLEKILQQRANEDNKLRESKQETIQLNKIQEDAKKEVELKRLELRNKILDIQKKADRKKRLIQQQITAIRGKIARDLIDAQKQGDANNCKTPLQALPDFSQISKYCDNNISDDFNKNMDCKKETNFCFICCENEFGSMFLVKRDECYSICDSLYSEQLKGGEFKWG